MAIDEATTMLTKEDEVTCPVCGATADDGQQILIAGFCSACRDYLAPERGGVDHGRFMIRTETLNNERGRRIASIRPRGFWSGAIEVRERLRRSYNPESREVEETWEVEISWGSGGADGTLDPVQAAENFTRALDHAVNLAKTWRTERGGAQ